METLLKTSEAAQILGVSRQHVVNMCDRGEMVCVHVGSHRRVPSSEVERVTSRRLTREEERSLWLHRALLSPLLTEPDTVVSAARENLRRWSGVHRRDGMAGWYFTKWQRVLNDGLDAVMHVLTSPSEDAREMRQNSPFAGILPEATRVAVLRSFKDHWDREHERAMTE